MVTLSQAQQMPEFGPDGRQSLFGDGGLRNLFAHHRTGMGFPPKWVVLAVAVVAFLAWRRRLTAVPPVAWALIGGGLLVWAVARLTMFTLYLPQRHTWWALPVGLAMLMATAVPALAQAIGSRRLRAAMLMASVAIVTIYAWSAVHQLRIPRDHDLDAAYAYLRTLPPDTLVAAHPLDADDVPMRARRSVLVSRETSISFMLGYYNRAKERLAAALAATYATDWCAVDVLGSRWGVDVFLVSSLPWELESYDEPFAAEVTGMIERGRRDGFVLRDPPPERILFHSGDVYVIRVDECAPGS